MSILVSIFAFICLFGGGLLGIYLKTRLPENHLADDSRHLLETGLGIIGTIGGLVLGLLVASAFGTYNTQRNSLVQMSADIIVLDRILAHYGPETSNARGLLHGTVQNMLDDVWAENGHSSDMDPKQLGGEEVYDAIENLSPKSDDQRDLKGRAISFAISLGQTRWLMYTQAASGISPPLLVMLIFFFTITFVGLGIFARRNSTVVIALFLAAVAVSGAIFMLQAMYQPFQGMMQISNAPLVVALRHIDN